jgi:hypothetical protein
LSLFDVSVKRKLRTNKTVDRESDPESFRVFHKVVAVNFHHRNLYLHTFRVNDQKDRKTLDLFLIMNTFKQTCSKSIIHPRGQFKREFVFMKYGQDPEESVYDSHNRKSVQCTPHELMTICM